MLQQGAQPRQRLRHEKLQRQHAGRKIIEEIRKLSADKETLTRLLAQTKKVISGSKEGYDAELALLREKHAETEERIKRLVESFVRCQRHLCKVRHGADRRTASGERDSAGKTSELEALTEQSRMLHQEFAFHQEMIESFASAVDSATLEEKRRLLRTIVKKVVWDAKMPMFTSLRWMERRIFPLLSNLCIRWERIANEILMMFRTGKKFSERSFHL